MLKIFCAERGWERKGEMYFSRPRASSGMSESSGLVRSGRIRDLRLLARMFRRA